MKIFASLGRAISGLFRSRDDNLKRSQLVGLYLSQTNSREAYTSEFMENRQRQNGKFQTRRERA